MHDLQAARGASLKTVVAHQARKVTSVAFLVAGFALAADQITKVLAVQHLTGVAPRPLVGDLLRLNLTYNPGAAFGLGGPFTVVISLVALVATGVIAHYIRQARTWGWAVALGLALAGVSGNLLDRLTREPGAMRGHVVDFLQLPHWPIFNVADICINAGAALILIQFARGIRLDGTRDE